MQVDVGGEADAALHGKAVPGVLRAVGADHLGRAVSALRGRRKKLLEVSAGRL